MSIEGSSKLRGTEDKTVQVDEAFFGGRAKYGGGRRLFGDRVPAGEKQAHKELIRELVDGHEEFL